MNYKQIRPSQPPCGLSRAVKQRGGGGGHAFDLCGGITTKLSTNDYIHTYLWVTLSGLSMTLSHAHTLNKQTHQTKAIHSGKNTQRQQLVWVGWDLRDHLRPSPLQAPNSHYCWSCREAESTMKVQACRHTDTSTRPHGHRFAITTTQGWEGGGSERAGSQGTENHFLRCQVHLAQLAVISLASGLAAGRWPIISTWGQRAIAVFD